MSKKIRVGVIGCGMVFSSSHMPAFLEMPDVELVAFYDISQDRATWIRDRYASMLEAKIVELETPLDDEVRWVDSWRWADDNIPAKLAAQHRATLKNLTVYESAEELLKNVDVVDVATPVKFHIPYVLMALKAGVHVMSEKAMGRSWWEAKEVVAAAKTSKAKYQLLDDNVFLPRYDTLRNIIEAGLVGDVQSMWVARGGHGPEARSWFWDPEVSGGGSLMDYGTHAIASLWYLIGYDSVPVKIKSMRIESLMKTRPLGGLIQTINVDDDAHIKVQFEQPDGNWCDAVIEATWSFPELGRTSGAHNGFIRIQGSEGQATGYIDDEGASYIKLERYGYGERLIPAGGTLSDEVAYAYEIKNFIECIRQDKVSILNAEVGSGIMQVMGAAYLSELKGRKPVTLEQFRQFCSELADEKLSVEENALTIIRTLMEPYKA